MNHAKAEPAEQTIELVRRKRAAQLCDISESFFRKLESHGQGPPRIQIGRSVRYSLDDLRAWIASRRVRVSG